MEDNKYDVIIIGGRAAGASLAVRLAEENFSVLVLDRATFPSPPSVPSVPLILPHTVKLLAEIGIDEAIVAESGTEIKRLQLEMNGHFAAVIDFAQALADEHAHFYSVKRASFDAALWENLSNYPNITAKSGYAVSKLLQSESGTVLGVEGVDGSSFLADIVVGADGRFSFVASQMKAETFNEVSDFNTDFFYAYWRRGKYERQDAMSTMHVYSNLNGCQYVIFPVGEDEAAVGIQMEHDLSSKSIGQSTDDYYLAELQKYPRVWNQLKDAEKISEVAGMKNIHNGYHELGGKGWVLAGDAAHFKDSIDAQGIFDALLGTKLLAAILVDWKAGTLSWEEALARYKEELLAETYPMFLETQARLKRDIYDKPPTFVVKNIIRRALEDPKYQEKFLAYVTRRIPPSGWASPALMIGALVRGIGRDLHK